MKWLTNKEVSALLGDIHPRNVTRWARRLGVRPSVPSHACHRWTPAQARRLQKKWMQYWQRRGCRAEAATAKARGDCKQAREAAQMWLRF